MKVLIIEDNKDVNNMLAEALDESNIDSISAFDGHQGVELFRNNQVDVVLLDYMLPFLNGEDILKIIRDISDVPVIVVSAKGLSNTKIDMLKLGADDYITKPFDIREVIARVEAAYRRANRNKPEKYTLTYKDMTMDIANKQVFIGENELILTAKEYMILEMLMKSPGQVFTKSVIYDEVWQGDYETDDNTVKTHMSNIRNKIKKITVDTSNGINAASIETVWGLGYRIK